MPRNTPAVTVLHCMLYTALNCMWTIVSWTLLKLGLGRSKGGEGGRMGTEFKPHLDGAQTAGPWTHGDKECTAYRL